jgi:hypothetical protein
MVFTKSSVLENFVYEVFSLLVYFFFIENKFATGIIIFSSFVKFD